MVLKSADGSEQGIRVSDNPLIKKICSAVEAPLLSTSANISGSDYVNDPEHIYSLFKNDISFMIDGGVLPESKPSSVVKLRDEWEEPEILREGAVSSREIKSVLS